MMAKTKKDTRGVLFVLVSQSEAKLNSACPALIDLKMGKFNPLEIKPLDKLELVNQENEAILFLLKPKLLLG